MARYARAMSLQTWNRLHEEDEAGFEGRRRRRRRQRRRQGRQGGRDGGNRRADRRTGQGQGGGRGRAGQLDEAEAPDQGWPQDGGQVSAPQGGQGPNVIYDDVPEDDDEEPEDDVGAPFRRGPRTPRVPGQRGGPLARARQEAGLRGGPFRRRQGRGAPSGVGPWGPGVDLGPHLKVKARKGFRAAVVEVKPGLFVVAEVPERSVEFGLGPLLLAPALVKTLGRAFRRRQAGPDQPGVQQQPASLPAALPPPPAPLALPGPVAQGDRLARWLDDDIAAELGCRACERRG